MAQGKGSEQARLTHEEFLKLAIVSLRDETRGKGCHVVYNGLNDAFRGYFGTEPRPIVEELVKQGKFVSIPAKGGIRLYLPDEAPEQTDKGAAALAKMGIA